MADAELRVRSATPADRLDVLTVLDGAMLATDDTVERRIDAGTVLVGEVDGRVLGTLVAVPRSTADGGDHGVHVEAIAVRRRRRDQGIGSALVSAAVERWGRLTASFDPPVRPFYESLGFEVESCGERCRGVLERDG